VVCNNAGVGPGGPMIETTPADWKWTVDVNILGVAHGVTAFGQLLVDQGEGHIVNTASEAGLVTNPMLGMYCATKHAVVGMSEALWREVHPLGVGVSVLCPNLIATKIFESERNRDDGGEMTANAAAMMAPMREMIGVAGIPPSEAATAVTDAILGDRFWVFTHDLTPTAAAVRFADIEAGRNPTEPYASLMGDE
jgi:short-subunit dehydrogenase